MDDFLTSSVASRGFEYIIVEDSKRAFFETAIANFLGAVLLFKSSDRVGHDVFH